MQKRALNWKASLLERSQLDPAWWIETVLGAHLWSKQKEICDAIVTHERVAVPACGDQYTEILTETRGWQFFKDLTTEDKVASLENGKLVFVHPEDYFEEEWVGDLVSYSSSTLNFQLTPNHRCYTKTQDSKNYSIQLAENIYGKRLRFNAEIQWEGTDTDFTEEHYEFLGFWCGDGSLEYSKEFRNCKYDVKVQQKIKLEDAKRLCRSFSIFAKSYSENIIKDDGTTVFHLRGEELAKWMLDNFGRLKSERRLPFWLKNSPPNKLKAFLKGFILADGWKGTREGRSDSVSIFYKGLADDIQEVALKAGYVFHLTEFEKVTSFSKSIVKGWGGTLVQGSKGRYPLSEQKNWYKQTYDGKVYCVQVPSGIILIRREGKYHWTGNSFGIGKTWLAARLTLWFLYNFRPAKIITTAPTNRQVKDLLWSELRTAHGKAKIPLGGEPLTLSLKIKDDQFAVGFSTEEGNMDMFTGYHAPNQMVVFDQAGGLPDMFWDAAEGLMTSENCRWLAISNTAISDCAFADICMPERKSRYGSWHIIPITAEESPNVVAGKNIFPGLVSYDWVERRRKAWGEDDPLYKIFVKAIFVPSVQMNVVPYKDLLRAYEYLGREDDAIEIGIDVARTGLDSTVMFARSGEKALEIKRLTGNDTMQVAGETIEFIRYLEQKYRKSVRVVKIDIIGIGAGVYDRLSEQDLPVLPINNAEVKIVVDRERFSNVRAEMAWAFRHRCEMGGVGLKNLEYEDSEIMNLLKGDLQIMKYKITSAGKIQIQLKEEIKKELGRSPDYWDACVMAFEEPGGGPAMVEFVSSATGAIYEKAVSDDDWLTMLGQKIDLDHPSFYKMDL